MRFGKLNKHDIANGEGVRVSLFVSGCPHRCKGCFNPETWDRNFGEQFNEDTINEILDAMIPDYITGLTILGGEPLVRYNALAVYEICKTVKRKYPHKSIWVYTGYLYEEVESLVAMRFIDVLVDGRFIEDQKDITLKFKGSKNQRIIDVKASRRADKVVLWEG